MEMHKAQNDIDKMEQEFGSNLAYTINLQKNNNAESMGQTELLKKIADDN
jgi:hypothetical protein